MHVLGQKLSIITKASDSLTWMRLPFFLFFLQLSCAWQQVPWLQQALASAQSSSSSLLQNRHNILRAVSLLQVSIAQHEKQSQNGFFLRLWFLDCCCLHSWSLCYISFSILPIFTFLTSDITGNYGPGTGVLWTSQRPTRQHSNSYSKGLSKCLQVRKVSRIFIKIIVKQEMAVLDFSVTLVCLHYSKLSRPSVSLDAPGPPGKEPHQNSPAWADCNGRSLRAARGHLHKHQQMLKNQSVKMNLG